MLLYKLIPTCHGNLIFFLFTLLQVLPEGKCGHINVLSKRQVWMSIFHIVNFKKKKKKYYGHRGPGFLIKN